MRAALLGIFVLLCSCAHTADRDRVIDYLSLLYASESGDEMLVGALLQRGAPANALGPDVAGDLSYMALQRNTPLQAASEKGHEKIVELLISHGAWLDAQCCDSQTPMGMAARNGHFEIVKLLLEAGADPNRRGEGGRPVDVARAAGHAKVVKLLESAAIRSK